MRGRDGFRGDLHMHDAHSDGSCLSQSGHKVPCPLYKTVETAAARGLDFIAVTDHNTTSHFDEMRELQPYYDKVLLIPGREITTFQGHANVYGTTEFTSIFRLTSKTVLTIGDLLDEAERAHGLISINHPGAPTGSICMGCGWSVKGTDYKRVGAVEALNGGSGDVRFSGIPFWEQRLKEGYRLTGVGGSDSHNATWKKGRSGIGKPTTVVYAANLSERAILDGIRAGHVCLWIWRGRGTVGIGVCSYVVATASGRQRATMGRCVEGCGGSEGGVCDDSGGDREAEGGVGAGWRGDGGERVCVGWRAALGAGDCAGSGWEAAGDGESGLFELLRCGEEGKPPGFLREAQGSERT